MVEIERLRRFISYGTIVLIAVTVIALAAYFTIHVPTVHVKVWDEYVDRKANGVTPFLTDFSYAGIHIQIHF